MRLHIFIRIASTYRGRIFGNRLFSYTKNSSMSYATFYAYVQRPLQKVQFVVILLIRIQEYSSFLNNIISTDESKFSREDIFNRRNHQFWANESPHVTKETGFQEKNSFTCLVYSVLMHVVQHRLTTNLIDFSMTYGLDVQKKESF